MICPDCDREFATPPCVCGYGTPLVPTAGPRFREMHVTIPFGITKEEFGIPLYESLRVIGGIIGIDEQRAVAIHKSQGAQLKTLVTRRRALQHELAGLLPTLPAKALDHVLARYPWVVQA